MTWHKNRTNWQILRVIRCCQKTGAIVFNAYQIQRNMIDVTLQVLFFVHTSDSMYALPTRAIRSSPVT